MTVPVLTRDTVRALDRVTIEYLGIPGLILMENAGAGAARVVLERLRRGVWHEPVLILAGTGNNGGDGFVIARHLHNDGLACDVVLVGSRARVRPGSDAHTNLLALDATGVVIMEAPKLSDELLDTIDRAGCVVDALFGTGLDRAMRDPCDALCTHVLATGAPVLAVDVPSGLHADTGQVLGAVMRAEVTATFVAAKPGLLRGEGPGAAGEIVVVPISIPRRLIARACADEEAFRAWAAGLRSSDKPNSCANL